MIQHGISLPEASMYLTVEDYNQLFGTAYTIETVGDFIPHKALLTHYHYSDVNNESPLFSKEVTILGLNAKAASTDLVALFAKDMIQTYSLYLDGTDGIGSVFDLADTLHYEHQSWASEGVYTMTKVMKVFTPIFELVRIFMCMGVVFIFMSFSGKMIKSKMHEIGILKALGTRNSHILFVFGAQVVLVALLTCLLSTVGYVFFIDAANTILTDAMLQFNADKMVAELKFLTFNAAVATYNVLLILALALVSLIIPLLKIKFIQPVKIIQTKD